jgi:hypothetical protein
MARAPTRYDRDQQNAEKQQSSKQKLMIVWSAKIRRESFAFCCLRNTWLHNSAADWVRQQRWYSTQ